jgi:hypothetical protein
MAALVAAHVGLRCANPTYGTRAGGAAAGKKCRDAGLRAGGAAREKKCRNAGLHVGGAAAGTNVAMPAYEMAALRREQT